MIKKYIYAFVSLFILSAFVLVASPAFAQTTPAPAPGTWGGHAGGGNTVMRAKGMMKPAVFGTVTAVSGNTITVSGKQGFGANVTATTFTVDATNAKIMKANVAGTISSIVVGDTIVAEGTLTGTNLVATTIRDGVMPMRGGTTPRAPGATPAFTGNGQPVVAGTVTSISGNTISITNKSNVTYTIDATNAKVTQGNTVVTVSSVVVGDNVVVQGTVNGNSVVATTVIDQHVSTTTTAGGTTKPASKGFFGGIGAFFSHLFGF